VPRPSPQLPSPAVPVEPNAPAAADVIAPFSLCGDHNEKTIPTLKAGIVCGAANNQLATAEDDRRLTRAGVLYCPDYLVNAGGLISVARGPLGLSDAEVERKLASLPGTLVDVLARAGRGGLAPGSVADGIARARFRAGPSAQRLSA
jgi:leucine dehydrogenase